MTQKDSVSLVWAWSLFGVLLVHNIEEAATMGSFLNDGAGGLGRWLGFGPQLLSPFLVAVTLVTIAALVLVLIASRGSSPPWMPAALRIFALVLVLNVLIPHVPAAIITGGYVPGIVSSLLLALPVGAAYLAQTWPMTPDAEAA